MRLSEIKLRNLKPETKQYKIYDGQGLYVIVTPKGKKYFRYDYRFQGKRKTISLGVYPTVSLKEARKKLIKVKYLLAEGLDPVAQRGGKKSSDCFEPVAREWFGIKRKAWTDKHARTVIRRLETFVFPFIGNMPLAQITPPLLLEVLRKIELQGKYETAHRVHQICGQIFRFAIATGKAERDPAADLRGALVTPKPRRMPTILEPAQIGELLRAIDGYEGYFAVKYALKLAPLVFVRSGELRHAEWKEIDFGQAQWQIPAEKMKIKRPHIVPLSRQAIDILKQIRPITGDMKYVFPSVRTTERPISNNTLNAALRRLGYTKDEMVIHGFRSMASTILNEHGWDPNAIERQLAHIENNSVRAAYNYAQYLSERRRMMQWWADYLDNLKKTKPNS